MTRDNGIAQSGSDGTRILSDVADEVLAYLESNTNDTKREEQSQKGEKQADSTASSSDAGNATGDVGGADGGGPSIATRELIDELAGALPESGALATPGSGSNINAAGRGVDLAGVQENPENLDGGTGIGSHFGVAPGGGASSVNRDSGDVKNVGEASAEDALGSLDRDAGSGDLTGELESGFGAGEGTSRSGNDNRKENESDGSGSGSEAGSDGEGVPDLVDGPENGGSGVTPGSRVMQDGDQSGSGNNNGEGMSEEEFQDMMERREKIIENNTPDGGSNGGNGSNGSNGSNGNNGSNGGNGSNGSNGTDSGGADAGGTDNGSGTSGPDSGSGDDSSGETSGDTNSIPAPGGSDPVDQPLADLGIGQSGSDAGSNPGGGAVDPMGHGNDVGETEFGFGTGGAGGQPGGGAVDPMGHGLNVGDPESLDILPDAGGGNPAPEGGTVDPAGFDVPTVGVDPAATHVDAV